MTANIHDARPCLLGEGPLWHPERGQLFWFDILGNRLLSQDDSGVALEWAFDENVSAAGWVDQDTLLVASETALQLFDIPTGETRFLCPLESDNSDNRSNDGRADPQGGFWIGTMPKAEDGPTGAIYRYYRGELRKLYPNIAIPNAISFHPDGKTACFADTAQGIVWRVGLDADGWPTTKREIYIDFKPLGLNPDGAVFDAEGRFWCAHWGAGIIAAYDTQGRQVDRVEVPARQSSCPAFGGADFGTLFCTSAQKGLDSAVLAGEPTNGQTFALRGIAKGRAEYRVIL